MLLVRQLPAPLRFPSTPVNDLTTAQRNNQSMYVARQRRIRVAAGAKLHERYGFISAEQLMEDLVPFMDHGPHEPGAGTLAQASLKRKYGAADSGAARGAGRSAGAPAANAA